jgi:hypothetical protein
MNGRRTTTLRALVPPALACLFVACLACLAPPPRVRAAKAALKKSDAQKLIAAYSLLELDKGAVSVKEITPGETSAAVRAGVRVGLRFERDAKGNWRAVEMRVGDRQWEDLGLLARALGGESLAPARAALDSFAAELDALARAKKQRDEEKKSAGRDGKNSREATRAGTTEGGDDSAAKKREGGKQPDQRAAKPDQKSDQKSGGQDEPRLVRGALSVKNPESALSPTGKSAVVEAEIEAAFDVVREGGSWRVASARVGGVRLPDPDVLTRALDAEKSKAARAELSTLAGALAAFRRERGFYVVADSEAALVDFLNPRYTTRFVRVDPWHRPYEYKGTRDTFMLRSLGPDGKSNTPDDVTLTDDVNTIHRNDEDD